MKKPLLLLVGLLLALTAATGCSIGFGGVSPAEAIDNAIKKDKDINSRRIDFDLNLVVSGDLESLDEQFAGVNDINLTLRGGADVDGTNPDSPAVRGNLAIEGVDELIEGIAGAGGGSDSDQELGAALISGFVSDIEFVVVDETAYVKLAGTWYEAGDFDAAADLSGVDLAGAGENSQCFQDAMQDPARFGSERLFKNLQEAGDEKIDGIETHHFTADVDLDKALTAIAEIARSCGDAETAGGIEGSKSQIVGMFRTFSVEIWIDDDDQFRQIKARIELDPAALAESAGDLDPDAAESADALESLVVNVTLKFSRFNESFNITKPDGDIQSLDDLTGSLGGFGLGGDLDDFEDFEDIEGLEDLEDLGGLGGTSTSTTGTSTSGFSR